MSKFDGEPAYAQMYWERALKRQSSDVPYVFDVTEEDHKAYPELLVGSRVYLVESVDGYVHSRVLAPRAVRELEGQLQGVLGQLKALGVRVDEDYVKGILEGV